MKKKISVAADWGASGGKMAKGYFDGKKLNIGDYDYDTDEKKQWKLVTEYL